MSEASVIVEALYKNFLLRDLFAKIVPGSIVLASVAFQNPALAPLNSATSTVGWPMILLGAGATWIVGFAIQEIGESMKIIQHHPQRYFQSLQRYGLRNAFKWVAIESENKQVERYAIIKEATGNFSTAILVSLLIIALRVFTSEDFCCPEQILLPSLVMLVLALTLLRANRSHAAKQYEYMESIVDGNPTGTKKIRAIVFDFDGVIADSMPLQEAAWKKTLASATSSLSDVQRDKVMANFWAGRSGRQLFEGTDIPDQMRRTLRNTKDIHWQKEQDSVPPMPGSFDTLKSLSKIVPLCIATSSKRDYVESALYRYGIKDLFSSIVTDDDVDRSKPAPDALLKISAVLRIPSHNLMMIGDTRTDQEMAAAAESQFILLDTRKENSHGGTDPDLARERWAILLSELKHLGIEDDGTSVRHTHLFAAADPATRRG